jgi:hypothetical protein
MQQYKRSCSSTISVDLASTAALPTQPSNGLSGWLRLSVTGMHDAPCLVLSEPPVRAQAAWPQLPGPSCLGQAAWARQIGPGGQMVATGGLQGLKALHPWHMAPRYQSCCCLCALGVDVTHVRAQPCYCRLLHCTALHCCLGTSSQYGFRL